MYPPFNPDLIDVAMGILPPDLLISGAQIVDVRTGEVRAGSVAIKDGHIASVGAVDQLAGPETEIHDVQGRFIMPGFVDGHQHIEDSRMSVTRFSDAVVPLGTTSVVSGLDHVIAVAGKRGLRTFLNEAEDTDINVFWASPFKLPYTDPPASIGFPWGPSDHAEVQTWPECTGVWEMFPDHLTKHDSDTLAAIEIARANRRRIFGSVPWAGEKLNEVAAHVGAGLCLDHEAYTQDEALEKIRLGLFVMIRDSPVEHFLPELIGLVLEHPEVAQYVGLCTDDSHLIDLRANGHMNRLVREAVEAGVPAITAIQMATINTSKAYGLDMMVGSITPGRRADILVADDLSSFVFTEVFAGGRLVARNGAMVSPSEPPARDEFLVAPFPRPEVSADELVIRADGFSGKKVRVRVIELTDNAFHRRAGEAITSVNDRGLVQADPEQDLALVAYVDRFGKAAAMGVALVRGFGLQTGALATSCCPDDENILCVGTNSEDMAVAINAIIRAGGSELVVADGRVIAQLPLPVAGIVSDAPLDAMALQFDELHAAARAIGCKIEFPHPFLGILGITAIPDYGLSEHGLVDANTHAVVETVIGTNGQEGWA